MSIHTPGLDRDGGRATSAVSLRGIEVSDLRTVSALNDREVPRVGPLGVDGLRARLPCCDVALVAVADDETVGFVLALAPGAAYDSANYQWFEQRGAGHLYVDRIVVATAHRQRGIAGMLYEAVEARARETGRAEITCEVNVRPPNPASMAFHEGRGFVEVGRQDTTGGTLTVAMLALPLT
jgi:predicted GNAT superfamily acetyltransferase